MWQCSEKNHLSRLTVPSIASCQDKYFLEHINRRATFFDRFEVLICVPTNFIEIPIKGQPLHSLTHTHTRPFSWNPKTPKLYASFAWQTAWRFRLDSTPPHNRRVLMENDSAENYSKLVRNFLEVGLSGRRGRTHFESHWSSECYASGHIYCQFAVAFELPLCYLLKT